MSFANEASKILSNKYFLYFIVFLAVTNVFGYLVTNKINATIFFALVAFLTSNFSKNMAVILLVAIVATNLLMVNKTMYEGLTSKDDDKDKLDSVDPDLGAGVDALEKTGSVAAAKSTLATGSTGSATGSGSGATGAADPAPAEAPKKKESFHNGKGNNSLKNAAPVNEGGRIDYSSTLEGAYENLDKILGSDGINKLTNDTQKLMGQQQKLFDTMQNMTPMLEEAKKMLAGFDMSQLGNLANIVTPIK
jgi:hypothetical protein